MAAWYTVSSIDLKSTETADLLLLGHFGPPSTMTPPAICHLQGTVDFNGIQTYKYKKSGLQPNYYYATADSLQLPVELDQWPNDFQFFHLDSYTTEPMDPSLALVPEGCKPKCPTASICSLLGSKQQQGQGQAEWGHQGSEYAQARRSNRRAASLK